VFYIKSTDSKLGVQTHKRYSFKEFVLLCKV